MCDLSTGLAAAGFLVSAAGSVVGAAGQQKASSKNAEIARRSERLQLADTGARQLEELTAASQQMGQVSRQGTQARALARLSAAESGVTGVSAGLAEDAISRDEAAARESIRMQSVVTMDQLQRLKSGIVAETEGRIAGMPGASMWATGLKIGSAGLDYGYRLTANK